MLQMADSVMIWLILLRKLTDIKSVDQNTEHFFFVCVIFLKHVL